jgi:hypothetical protein
MRGRDEAYTRDPAAERRPYRPPRLVVYGSLRELTAAGIGSTQEKGVGGGQTAKRP